MRIAVIRSKDRPATMYGEHLYSSLILALSRFANIEELEASGGGVVRKQRDADLVLYDGPAQAAQSFKSAVWVPTLPTPRLKEDMQVFKGSWIWQRGAGAVAKADRASLLPNPPLLASVTPVPDSKTVGVPIDGSAEWKTIGSLAGLIAAMAKRVPGAVFAVPAGGESQLLAAGVDSGLLAVKDSVDSVVETAGIILGSWEHAFFAGLEMAVSSNVPAFILAGGESAKDPLGARLVEVSDADALVEAIGKLGAAPDEDGADTALPVDTEALTERIRELLKIDGSVGNEAIASRLKDNSGFALELESNFFNPWNRIVELNIRVHCSNPVCGTLFGEIVCEGRDLSNAYVTTAGQFPGGLLLKAVAVLPDDVELSELFVDIFSGDVLLETVYLKDITISPQTGGLISLDIDGTTAVASHWSDAGNQIQHGKRLPEPTTTVELDGRPAFYETRSPWPMNRETLTVLPAEGAVAQRFTRFDSLCVGSPPSTPSLRELKDAYAGRRVWLVGNGPSVRLEDLDRLENELTFCFNRFYLAHDSTRLRATFTVSGDKQMIEDFGDEIIAESGGRVFLANETAPNAVGKYHWLRQVTGFPSLFSKDASVRVAPGGSSLYVAMQVAYYLGIRDFFIYGADFKFSFQRNRNSADAFRTATGDGNHFIKNYRSGKAWAPPSVQNILSSFLAARTLIEAEGGKIWNTTHGGELEVFSRLPFEEALAADFSAAPAKSE